MSGNNDYTKLQELFLVDGKPTPENFREALIERVVYLLKYDLEWLLSVLYRIDVNEKDVKAAFAQSSPTAIAPLLVDAVLKREAAKAVTREQYKHEQNPN
jgi:hypothetical protein